MAQIILSKRERQLIDKLSNDHTDAVALDLQRDLYVWRSEHAESFEIDRDLIYRFVGLLVINKDKITKTLYTKMENLVRDYNEKRSNSTINESSGEW